VAVPAFDSEKVFYMSLLCFVGRS